MGEHLLCELEKQVGEKNSIVAKPNLFCTDLLVQKYI